MLVNNVDIKNYKAELLDRAISTTVVHSITDWMDEATEGSLLRQAYDWRNIKLTFLIREIDEDQAYKRISALTEALKNCTLRFDDIDLDFPCLLDGTTVPDRLQNGVFKVIFNLKNDWALGEPVSFTYHVAPANAKTIHVNYVRNWASTMEGYTSCFDENEVYEQLGTDDFYIDLAIVEELANKNTSWSEFFLELGVPVNKYKQINELNGFLDIEDRYSPAKAKEIIEAREEFTVYYNRFHKDGYNDFPDGKTYPSLVWKAREGNTYYFDTGIGQGLNIQDISVVITGRWYDISGGGCMFGIPDVEYSMWKYTNEAWYLTNNANPYSQQVFNSDTTSGNNLIIETLEPIADVPLREYGIKSSNQGASPVSGFVDLVFNGITLTRIDCGSLVLDKNLCIAYGYKSNGSAGNYALDRGDIARVRIYYKDELIQDLIPIAGSLKNCFVNDYDTGLYDVISMKFMPWTMINGTQSRQPDKDLMLIPGMPDMPMPPPDANTYTVSVKNGSGSGNYEVGALVIIQANEPADNLLTFDKWTYSAPITLTASDEANPNSFTMIAQDVVLTPTYKYKPVYVEPRWLIYNSLEDLQKETTEALVGRYAASWDDEPTAGMTFWVSFSVPGITGVTYYPGGNSGKTLKKKDQGTWNGRFWVSLYPNNLTGWSGCDITGTYNGQTYTKEFEVKDLY